VIQDLQIAIQALQRGDPANAKRACKRVLRRFPDNVDALVISGVASFQRNDFEAAAQALFRAIELAPNHADALNNLGIVLIRLGRHDEAAEILSRATDLRPNDAETHFNLGLALQRGGSIERAAGRFRDAIALHPRFATAHTHLAQMLRDLGQFDEAAAEARRALAIRDDAEAYLVLSDIKRFEPGDDDVGAMELLLESGRLGSRETTSLSLALGKAYDDLGEYGRAFDMFRLGNRLRREALDYDIAEDEDLFHRIKQVFEAPAPAEAGGSSSSDDTPIFIVGMPRSGTTLVEQILASHPDVYGAGEVEHMETIIGRIEAEAGNGSAYPEVVAALTYEDCLRFARDYVEKLRADAGDARRVTDKLPGNFRHVGLICRMLPNARIIHCMRDPVDTCLSCFQKNFGNRQKFSWNLKELGRYFCLYRDLMAHWTRVMPGQVFELRYEDLVAEPESRIREMLAYCGLPWDDQCLAFDRTRRPVSTASAEQVRRPIYGTSVQRWRNYEEWLGPLLKALGPFAPPA